jgi:hypothetical protein
MPPLGECYNWAWKIVYTSVAYDGIIFLSLLWIAWRVFQDGLPKRGGWEELLLIMLFLLGALTHLMGIVIIYYPLFWLQNIAKGAWAGICLVSALVIEDD